MSLERRHLASKEINARTAALVQRAATEIENNDLTQALATLRELDNCAVVTENHQFLKAYCCAKRGQLEEARVAIQQELRAFPNNGAAKTLFTTLFGPPQGSLAPTTAESLAVLQDLGDAYLAGNHDRVLHATEYCIQRGISAPGINRYRGEAYLAKGDIEAAFHAFMVESSAVPTVLKQRAICATKLAEQAIQAYKNKDYRRAYKLGSDLATASFNFPRLERFIGLCCEQLGVPEEAQIHFKNERQIHPPLPADRTPWSKD